VYLPILQIIGVHTNYSIEGFGFVFPSYKDEVNWNTGQSDQASQASIPGSREQ